jgi:PadR family transcriptional regulator, regulatory protein PadR
MSLTSNEKKMWIKLVTGLLILKILKDMPAYGNQIADEIKRVTQDTIKPNPNFIYPLLRQMEEDGYVEGSWENPKTRGKRIYTITASGFVYFEQLKEVVQAKFLEIERCQKAIRSFLFED